MTRPVTRRPRARLDLLDQFIYFAERESVDLAERYLAAVHATCLRLADHPRSGARYDSGLAKLKGLRRSSVKGFDNYLVFHMPRKSGIDVIRVLHGARDIDSLFLVEEA